MCSKLVEKHFMIMRSNIVKAVLMRVSASVLLNHHLFYCFSSWSLSSIAHRTATPFIFTLSCPK